DFVFSRVTGTLWDGHSKRVNTFSTRSWRLYLHQPHRDKSTPTLVNQNSSEPTMSGTAIRPTSLLAWNGNGFNYKGNALLALANRCNIGVVILGEHLRKSYNYEPKMEGYKTFNQVADKGFRGLCMLVRNDLGAYQKPTKSPHLMHLVITGLEK
ncbi:hypothetical protein VP01_12929g1, partial [Puccinia sorghi]